jgi:ketosteroid isomerase-like protein
MADRSEIEALVKRLYAARVEGDMDALGQAFAENARFQVAGSPEASMLATHAEGHDGVIALLQTMTDTFALEDFAILDLLIDGGRAAVRWRATVLVAASGDTHATEVADFLTVENGRVVSLVEFLDTALAV